MLHIVRSILESSSESSEEDDDNVLEILTALRKIKQVEDLETDNSGGPSSAKRPKPAPKSNNGFPNRHFRDIYDSRLFSLDDFKLYFKISRVSFEELLQYLHNPFVSAGRPPVGPKDSLLITIWTLANQEPYRLISERFRISIGHCMRVFQYTCQKLFKLTRNYIDWPTGSEALNAIEDFNMSETSEVFPNVIGCIGTTHILIPASHTDLTYYDKKGNNSVIVQAVCNSKQEFVNVVAGWPGSVHYAYVLSNSTIYNKLKADPDFIPPSSYLLGDSTLPLEEFLMVPYRDTDCVIGEKEKKFNELLNNTRSVINRAFGRLKGLFSRLKFLNVLKVDNVKHIVMAACILHNLSIRDDVPCEETDVSYQEAGDLEPVYHLFEENQSAYETRQNILNELFPYWLYFDFLKLPHSA